MRPYFVFWGNFYFFRIIRWKGLQGFKNFNHSNFQKKKDESECDDMSKVMQFVAELILMCKSSDAQFCAVSVPQNFTESFQAVHLISADKYQCIYTVFVLFVVLRI